jgi:hypothetical protein
MSNAQSNQTSKFIDLQTTGLGYLFRVREVKPKKGQPFIACTINAFHGEVRGNGEKSEMTYVKFDVKVTGEQAIQDVLQLKAAANNEDQKVLVKFNIGDYYIDTFEYTKGEKAGQMGMLLKGRLLKIHFAKVDNQLVINNTPPKASNDAQAGETPAAPASNDAQQQDAA